MRTAVIQFGLYKYLPSNIIHNRPSFRRTLLDPSKHKIIYFAQAEQRYY